MNTKPSRPSVRPEHEGDDLFSFLWMWCAFVSGALVLSWLFSEVNNFNNRGEQRELQQRADGALVLADDPARTVSHDAVLTVDRAAPASVIRP